MVSTSQFTVCIRSNKFPTFDTDSLTGSAPDISGKGIVNPVAMILSVSMMLKYSLCEPELAAAVDKAVKNTIDNDIRTGDIGGKATTKEVGDAMAAELARILKEK
jgi:3-isopropylmalate dehydrogenase